MIESIFGFCLSYTVDCLWYSFPMKPTYQDRIELVGQSPLRPSFRVATQTDLQATYNVYLAANEDLNLQLGRCVDLKMHNLRERALAVRRSGLRYDRETFWIAEVDGRVGGFGLAIRRRSLWYLAALHVLPEFQGQGVGTELIRRCLGRFEADEDPWLLTTSDSANMVSNGLYLRFGLAPQSVILQLHGQARSLGRKGVSLRRADSVVARDCFDRIDRIVLGEIRPEDHQCWAGVPFMLPYLVFEGDRMVGYIYIDREGALGPAGLESPELLAPTISAAIEVYAADQSAPLKIRIPNDAREALRALMSHGFNCLTEVELLLSSRQFGRLGQYLFSGADALF